MLVELELEPKYRGPYVVVKVLDNDRYLVGDLADIQRNQRPYQSVFSSDKMKKWCHPGPEAEEDIEDDDDRDGLRSGRAELSAGMKRSHSASARSARFPIGPGFSWSIVIKL